MQTNTFHTSCRPWPTHPLDLATVARSDLDTSCWCPLPFAFMATPRISSSVPVPCCRWLSGTCAEWRVEGVAGGLWGSRREGGLLGPF